MKKQEIAAKLEKYHTELSNLGRRSGLEEKSTEDVIDIFEDTWLGVAIILFNNCWHILDLQDMRMYSKNQHTARNIHDKDEAILPSAGDAIDSITVSRSSDGFRKTGLLVTYHGVRRWEEDRIIGTCQPCIFCNHTGKQIRTVTCKKYYEDKFVFSFHSHCKP